MHQFQEPLACGSVTKTENEDKDEDIREVPRRAEVCSDIDRQNSCKISLLKSFSFRNICAQTLERENIIIIKLISISGLKARICDLFILHLGNL